MAADTASFLDPELSIAPSLSTEDVRQRLRTQGGQTRAATRPSSAAAMGVGPGVGQRGTTTRGGPPGVAAAHAEQFVRMKRSTRSSRPHSADSRLSLAQQAELAQAQAEGWTVSERMHIKNDAIGFIQDGRRFPWQEDRAANNHLKEISPHLATHSSFQELPADEAHANRVEKALDVVYASYFPVSRQWDLRTEGGTDGGRLMSEVDVTSVVNQRGGEVTFATGQMPGWRMRETNLMQLMTLLRRTCSLGNEALDKLRPQLISLAEEPNPMITRGRFFAIMEVMFAGMGVKGNDVDTMERMSRVFNVKAEGDLTFHEMLDGLAILLGGAAIQKFELYFLMYHHVDPRRVGSGAALDRMKGSKGQKHAAASHYCVYRMMTEINRQLLDPIMEQTGLEKKLWKKNVAEEVKAFVDDVRCSGHTMLTFSQLWEEMNKNVRKRPWLLSLIAIDQLEMVDCGVDTSVWKSEYEFDTSFHAAKNALKAGVRAVEALNTPALRGMRSEEAREVERLSWIEKEKKRQARLERRNRPKKENISDSALKGMRPKAGMNFRRNATAMKSYHKGAKSLEEADRISMGLKKEGDKSPRQDGSGAPLPEHAAVPLYTVALRAAAKAKEEVENGGVTWEFDSSLPKPPGQTTAKVLRWKRFDRTTEMTIEAAFQANTNSVTMSTATWQLGEEFLRHEGDGAAMISFLAETTLFERESWHGMVMTNRRSGRRKRVRRIYRLDLADATTPRLREVVSNIGTVNNLDANGHMHREPMLQALVDQELTLFHARRRRGLLLKEEERGGPPPRQLNRAQSKETFSVIYSEANAAGVVDVLSVLKALRERVKTLPRGADSRSTSPDPGSNPRSPEADDSAGNDEEAAAEGEGGEQAAGEEHEGFKLAPRRVVGPQPPEFIRY